MLQIPFNVLNETEQLLCLDFNRWIEHLKEKNKAFNAFDGKYEYYYKILRRLSQGMVLIPPNCILCFKGEITFASTGKHYWIENSPFFGVHESCMVRLVFFILF